MNLEEYRQLIAKPKKRHKYNAKGCVVDGIRFDSIKEADYYKDLKLRQKAGEFLRFDMQVKIQLSKRVKYFCDFVIHHKDGTKEYIDVKGYPTPVSKVKIKIAEDLYGIKINLK